MIIEQYQQQHWGHSSHSFWQSIGKALQNFGKRIEHFAQVAEQRRQLLEMDDHLLRDIGLNRSQAIRLAKKL